MISTEGLDYQDTYNSVIEVSVETSQYCVDIFITDDEIVEGNEKLFVRLNSTSEGDLIEFMSPNVSITIRDNDGKLGIYT